MGANYSSEVKNIEIWVPAFFKHNNSSVATVYFLSYDINIESAKVQTNLAKLMEILPQLLC
jgi:hypothetical protein